MQQHQKKRVSPFSAEFWINKGYSEEEAEYKRNSIRPIRKEYWLERGYCEEEAIQKAYDTKQSNNKKGSKKRAEKPTSEIRKISARCKEYWIEKGYTEEEAISEVSRVQATFSLEKNIEKYGLVDGTKRWRERQEKWQNTLNAKPEHEKQRIRKSKNWIKIEHFSSVDECIEKLAQTKKVKLFKTFDEFVKYLKEDKFVKQPYLQYTPIEYFVKKHMSQIQKSIFRELYPNECIKEKIHHLFEKAGEVYIYSSKYKQSYRQWTDDGYLRSSYEIYFYNKLKECFPGISVCIDGKYPNSSFRYDFYLEDNVYIEICPSYDSQDKYRQKMNKKVELFGCILLKDIEEIDDFIENRIKDYVPNLS